MGVYQRGGSWYLDFFYDGQRYRERVGQVNKTVAKEKLVIRKREVIQGAYKPKAIKILFKEFAPEYLEHAKLNKKLKSALRNEVSIKMLLPHFGASFLDKINTFMVDQYKKMRKEEGRAPATINRDVATLRNMLNMAIEWKYIKENPLRNYKQLKEQNEKMWCLSYEEERKLLEACDNAPQDEKYLPDMVLFALHSGMRLEEILSLKKSNVDVKKRFILLTNTKNNETRRVPINNTLMEVIERRLARKDTEFIFCNAKGGKLNSLTNGFWNSVKAAGLHRFEDVRGEMKEVRFRFHDLRHTFGSRLGMAGVDVKTTMEIMGHKTYKMAMKYQHPAPDHKRNAVHFLDGLTPNFTTGECIRRDNVYNINGMGS